MRRGRIKGMPKQLNPKDSLEDRFSLVQSIYAGWLSLPCRMHCEQEKLSCENLLEELLGFGWKDGQTNYFESDEDLRERVEEWLEETEKKLKVQFEEKLKEACLSRCREEKLK